MPSFLHLSPEDWQAIWLTVKLASITTVLLFLFCTPLAWLLANKNNRCSALIQTISSLPLVLPPTVIGFYCLIAFSPTGLIGQFTQSLGIQSLAFSFSGIVIASCFYSLPFVLQPLQNSFQLLDRRAIEAAQTLQAKPFDIFFSIILPQCKQGFISAGVLGFAHTVGEFGVILMVGGNIPGQTRVASVQIYDHVESLAFSEAHQLSLLLLAFSFIVLFALYSLKPNTQKADIGVL